MMINLLKSIKLPILFAGIDLDRTFILTLLLSPSPEALILAFMSDQSIVFEGLLPPDAYHRYYQSISLE